MEIEPQNLKQERTTFYSLELNSKQGKLFFNSKNVLNDQLFIYLSKKLYSPIIVSVRTNSIFQDLFGWLFKVEKEIPNKNVFLIYEGYDSTVYFYKEKGNISLIREKDDIFTNETFKGFPIHYDFSLDHIVNKDIIIKVLKEHLSLLKTNLKNTHGDFTNYNILVDNNDKISIIDPKGTESSSILTDHFYFYSYFLIRTRLANPLNKKRVKSIEKELYDIYHQVFKGEDISLLDEIEKIASTDFVCSNNDKIFQYWKNRYYNLMKEILK